MKEIQTEMMTRKGTTLPLTHLKGKPYLMVAHRLVWFREECPNHSIVTEFVQLTESYAIAKATIKYNDVILATSHKREDQKHFPDFMEKAETGAIGRAVALIGYGTQFAPEFDEEERIVDSPVKPSQKKEEIKQPETKAQPSQDELKKQEDEEQMRMIRIHLKKTEWAKEALLKLAENLFGTIHNLSVENWKEILEIAKKHHSLEDWLEAQ